MRAREHFLAEQLGELCLQRFLAHIFAAAGGWMALGFIGVAGATPRTEVSARCI
jgi:hypothetical protein